MLIVGALAVAAGLFVTVLALYLARQQALAVGPAGLVPAALVADDIDAPPAMPFGYRALEPLLNAGGELLRKLTPAARVDLIRKRIVYAGLDGRWTVEKQFGVRVFAAVVGLVVGFVAHPHQVPALLAAVILGTLVSFVPDLILDSKARERQHQIARALPDALDLLAITVEAGLGLEQGLEVVCERLHGPLGDELDRMLREAELGVSRRDALGLLRARTDVRELSTFIVALLQAEELGVAVSDVLKVQAAQVRLVRTQLARERAAKTPVKILFPLILGVFPAIFVVSVGPGAIQIYHTIIK